MTTKWSIFPDVFFENVSPWPWPWHKLHGQNYGKWCVLYKVSLVSWRWLKLISVFSLYDKSIITALIGLWKIWGILSCGFTRTFGSTVGRRLWLGRVGFDTACFANIPGSLSNVVRWICMWTDRRNCRLTADRQFEDPRTCSPTIDRYHKRSLERSV